MFISFFWPKIFTGENCTNSLHNCSPGRFCYQQELSIVTETQTIWKVEPTDNNPDTLVHQVEVKQPAICTSIKHFIHHLVTLILKARVSEKDAAIAEHHQVIDQLAGRLPIAQ